MRKTIGLMLLIVAVGCSSAPVNGIVTAKAFTPAHSFMVVMPITMSDGRNTTTTLIPVWFHEPDRWTLTIEPYDSDGKPLAVRKIMVQRGVYDTVKIGEWFANSPDKIDTSRAKKIIQEE